MHPSLSPMYFLRDSHVNISKDFPPLNRNCASFKKLCNQNILLYSSESFFPPSYLPWKSITRIYSSEDHFNLPFCRLVQHLHIFSPAGLLPLLTTLCDDTRLSKLLRSFSTQEDILSGPGDLAFSSSFNTFTISSSTTTALSKPGHSDYHPLSEVLYPHL